MKVQAGRAASMPGYPIVYLDCIHVKVRDGSVRVKALYLAIGLNLAGEKEVLGLLFVVIGSIRVQRLAWLRHE